MSERRAYLYKGIGETVGVVTLDGRPERLVAQWDVPKWGDDPLDAEGVRGVARVKKIERAFNSAFVALPGGADLLLALKPDMPKLVEGQVVEIEIRTPSRRDKSGVARYVGPAEGEPRVLTHAPTIEELLRLWVKSGSPTQGLAALEAVEAAEAEALATVFALPGGGDVSIEATRALVAIDVDLGGRDGDSKKAARAANMAAFTTAARILRLKGLAGLVVFDLVGRGHDGPALTTAARNAFAVDNPGVGLGPISKFGALEMIVPRRTKPILDRLLDETGALAARAGALRLVRAFEREGRADPGGKLMGRCGAAVAEAFADLDSALADKIGRRFTLAVAADWPNDRLEVSSS
jgi:hypothetical protein